MHGNARGLDAKGYCSAEVTATSASFIHRRVDKEIKVGEIETKDLDILGCTNWWVCEGWSPITFTYKREKSNMPHSKPKPDEDVLIHLSIDGFEPDLIHINPLDKDEYIVTRMVPSIQIQYYFSFEGIPKYLVWEESESSIAGKYPDLK